MIFVMLGTQKQQFTRLLDILENSNILQNEEIIVQAGHTKYNSKFMKINTFFDTQTMKKYMIDSDFVITHGGVGSIIDALNLGKKVLAVPRLKKFAEHINDHQIEICQKLYEEGYIEYLLDGEDLVGKLQKLKENNYKKYERDKKYLEILEKDIKEFLK
ncbi:MAG: glycosyltransferase family 28 [Clostridia bacterium]|nr:glycosyltransferase family 28 [Clostridia bacterium]